MPEKLPQTDHLFLLVGGNPLPNYVAARLLAKDDGVVYLLHTQASTGTFEIADRLAKILRQDCPRLKGVQLHQIHETDGFVIAEGVEKIAAKIPANQSVGLNYTGGTKPMTWHAARALDKNFDRGRVLHATSSV